MIKKKPASKSKLAFKVKKVSARKNIESSSIASPKRSVKKKSIVEKITRFVRKKIIKKSKPLKLRVSLTRRSKLKASPVLENDLAPLPFSYQKTMIVALVRDPLWLYAYWDFTAETWTWINQLLTANLGSKGVIRLHNLTQKSSKDFYINFDGRQWYLEPACPGAEIELELGVLDANGRFYSIATSNRIRMPLNGPSSVIDPLWMPIHFEEFYRLSGGSPESGSSIDSSSVVSNAFAKPVKVSS